MVALELSQLLLDGHGRGANQVHLALIAAVREVAQDFTIAVLRAVKGAGLREQLVAEQLITRLPLRACFRIGNAHCAATVWRRGELHAASASVRRTRNVVAVVRARRTPRAIRSTHRTASSWLVNRLLARAAADGDTLDVSAIAASAEARRPAPAAATTACVPHPADLRRAATGGHAERARRQQQRASNQHPRSVVQQGLQCGLAQVPLTQEGGNGAGQGGCTVGQPAH